MKDFREVAEKLYNKYYAEERKPREDKAKRPTRRTVKGAAKR